METVTVWQVLVLVLIPLVAGGFILIIRRQELQSRDMTDLQLALANSKLENEQHFVRRDSLNEMKNDIISHIDNVISMIQGRVKRVETDVAKIGEQ